MKNIWKWILGIVIVLVVVTALVAVPIIMRNTMAANFSFRATQQRTAPGANQQAPGWNGGPMMRGYDNQQGPQGRFNNQRNPMMGNGRNFERGFSRFGGFTPFGFGFMFLGGLLRLIPLALFGLLLYGVYQLGKRAGVRSTLSPAPVSTQPTPPAAANEEQQAK